MKILKQLVLLLFLLPAFAFAQREEKPRYAPGREKHRNKTDELGQRQGVWKYYNEAGELNQEIEYLDDVRNGVAKNIILMERYWRRLNTLMVLRMVFLRGIIITVSRRLKATT